VIPPFFNFAVIDRLIELEAQGRVRMDALNRKRAELEADRQRWSAYDQWKADLKAEGWDG